MVCFAAWCLQAGLQQHRLICSDGSADESSLEMDRKACIELGMISNGVRLFGASFEAGTKKCAILVHSTGLWL